MSQLRLYLCAKGGSPYSHSEHFVEEGEDDNVSMETMPAAPNVGKAGKTQLAGTEPSETSQAASGERVILGEFAVDRITSHIQDPNAKDGDWIARIKWVALFDY